MRSWKFIITAISAVFVFAGCGSSEMTTVADASGAPTGAIVYGIVTNNHHAKGQVGDPVANAEVVLVKAGDIEEVDSIQPVEDLANSKNDYPMVKTAKDGSYSFVKNNFNDKYTATGEYIVFVKQAKDSIYWPGGSASRVRASGYNGKNAVKVDTEITYKNDDGIHKATYVGSSKCQSCHQKVGIKHTAHFTGLRKVGVDGMQINGIMDLASKKPYPLEANSNRAIEKFTNPATQYHFSKKSTDKSFWLGKDDKGLYFQLTSNTNPKFYVNFVYGGETGKWKARYITQVYDNAAGALAGTYAPNHGINKNGQYAYFVMSPIQFNESSKSMYGRKFVPYHTDRWDFAGTKTKGFTSNVEKKSFDTNCAACHGAVSINSVKGKKVAMFAEDANGYSLNELDGKKYNINVSCEKCHGPGSNHIKKGGMGSNITYLKDLPAGRLTMVCGSCHIRGKNNTHDVAGEPALLADGHGHYNAFTPGMSPADFFGTADGSGIAPFETDKLKKGFLSPINYAKSKASWKDKKFQADHKIVNTFTKSNGKTVTRTQVTGVFNHSHGHHQQYEDLVRTKMYKNDRELLTCASCHDSHGSEFGHMTILDSDSNALCISCHNGSMRKANSGTVDYPDMKEGKHTANFQYITKSISDRLSEGKATAEDTKVIGKEVMRHIGAWASKTMAAMPYDPEGKTKMGRCTYCHMPKTAKSADFSKAKNGFIQGDIHSHTFDVMSSESISAMLKAKHKASNVTPSGWTNNCASCHAVSQ